MMIVARYRVVWLAEMTAAGAVSTLVGVAFSLWIVMRYGISWPLIRDGMWWLLLLGVWFVLLGGIWLFGCIRMWENSRRVLALDAEGIHWWRPAFLNRPNEVIISWSDVLGAKVVTINTEAGSDEALVIGLTDSATNPAGGLTAKMFLFGQRKSLPWTNIALIPGSGWDWEPYGVQLQIEDWVKEWKQQRGKRCE